jgi:imidazolonepropionase-like amidohydrolase
MPGAAVVVEDDRIKDVMPNGKVGPLPGPVTTLDCRGATLMPGLTDAHVHICAVEGNITDQHRYLPPSLLAAKALRRAEECLMQGFTTVRDVGSATDFAKRSTKVHPAADARLRQLHLADRRPRRQAVRSNGSRRSTAASA